MNYSLVYPRTHTAYHITLLLGLLLLMVTGEVWAATCTSKASGLWGASSSWNCSSDHTIPIAGDTAVIANGFTITLNTKTATVAALTINSGGTFNETNNATSYNVSSGSVTNNGNYNGGAGSDTFTGAFTNGGTYTGGSGSISLSGNFSNSGTFTAGGTWTFNGASAQTVSGTATFANLSISNTTGVTFSNTLSISGNLSNTGTFTANGTTTLGGTSAQTIGGTGTTTFANLTISNTSGVTLAGNTTVSGTLALGANTITTGSYTLSATGNCTSAITRSSGFVIGNLQLTFPSGTTTCTYPIGTGTTYAPINLTPTTTSSGTLTGSTTAGDHPQIASAFVNSAYDVNRYWTLSATGDTLTTNNVSGYSVTFNFASSEVDAGATVSTFVVDQYVNGAWSFLLTPSATSSTSVSLASVAGASGFGDFITGQYQNNCYHENFARANGAPGNNWSVGTRTGSWTPQIVTVNSSKRLQLTDTNGGEATWATLRTGFPGAGNRVSLDFDAYAYGGTGADGIGIILSDAAIPPVAGAFGGSMGYAQKSNPGSDCTNTGGCPGFSGGWLGVALDEYGNFSSATEGRYLGQTQYGYNGSTAVVQSVSARGSGSGMSGYKFIAGTNSLTPHIDGTANQNANPPYHYRITVDHTNSINAYLSVERDTTSGGSNYTTLLGCAAGNISGCSGAIDVLNPVNSQSAVPITWLFSFTGSTGGSTNYHQLGGMQVCTTFGFQAITLDHLAIYEPGSACTGNTSPASVTIKACANSACTSLYLGTVTATLSTSGNAAWSTTPVTFSGGQTTVTLTDNTAQSVNVGATATSPTAANATTCFNNAGTSVSCSSAVTFSACTFDVVEVGANAFTPIYTKLAGVNFSLDVKSLSSTSQSVTKAEIVDASSGTCATYPSLVTASLPSPALPATFTANQTKPFSSFLDNNAVRNARIRITYGSSLYACSSDNFAIRPTQFTLATLATNTATTGTPVFKAGTDSPTVTATAVNNNGAAVSGYDGTPKFNLTPGSSMLTVGTPTTQTLGTLSATAFPKANSSTGVAQTFVTYFDAGNLTMAAGVVYDDGFTAVDATKTYPECTSDFSNTVSGGKYGCMFDSTAALGLGRFIPDHFSMTSPTLTPGCSAGTNPYTYMGQNFPMSFTLNALNSLSQNTINYDPTKFAAAFGTTTWANYGFTFTNGGSSTLGQGASSPTGTWSSGVASISASGNYARRTSGPEGDFPTFSVYAAPSYLDGGATVSATSTLIGTTQMRYGQLWLGNAYGVDNANLSIPYTFQYWKGTAFVTNTDDKCSAFTTSNIALANYQINTSSMNSSHLGAPTNSTSGGGGTITLTKPTPSGNTYYTGSVDLVVNLGATASTTSNSPAPDQVTTTSGAGLSYLRGNWYTSYPWTSDPICRATFGVYNSQRPSGVSGPVYLRENY